MAASSANTNPLERLLFMAYPQLRGKNNPGSVHKFVVLAISVALFILIHGILCNNYAWASIGDYDLYEWLHQAFNTPHQPLYFNLIVTLSILPV